MTDISRSLLPVDSLTVDVLTDDVSDNYVSKILFAVSRTRQCLHRGAKPVYGYPNPLRHGRIAFGAR